MSKDTLTFEEIREKYIKDDRFFWSGGLSGNFYLKREGQEMSFKKLPEDLVEIRSSLRFSSVLGPGVKRNISDLVRIIEEWVIDTKPKLVK